jgi:hypothetical protein
VYLVATYCLQLTHDRSSYVFNFVMRLLNIETLEFKAFKGKDLPPYAIASHRWRDGEASYHDIRKQRFRGEGYKKVKRFCKFAQKMNNLRRQEVGQPQIIEWIWIDTCCIDHGSSQDVSESIASMYKYYERAAECYAYLFDVSDAFKLPESCWFTRGWTLQELLAPSRLIIINANWEMYVM